MGAWVPQPFLLAEAERSPGAASSPPGPQLQCGGTTAGALLISLVKITVDLQCIVLHVHFCKEGPVAGGSSRGNPG